MYETGMVLFKYFEAKRELENWNKLRDEIHKEKEKLKPLDENKIAVKKNIKPLEADKTN